MTIYQLECFIAVAEELNFSAAAQRLFTTQPAVTYQINTLEKETGLHLFDRTTRRTKLTAAGQSFYLDMVQMTSFGRQALKKAQDIQAADRSHLVVGLRQLFDYGTFASILAEYQRQYPNAQVEVIPQSNRRPLEELRSGQLDIGFFYATEHSSDRDVSFTPLFSLAYYVLMNPNCPLADRKALHLADLKGQSVVSSGAFDSFLSACQGPSLEELAQVGVDCSKITPSFEGALIMITMGTAMSIVPCLDDAVIPGITKVPLLDYPPVTVEIAAMRHTPRLEVQSFIEIAKRKYSRSFPEQFLQGHLMVLEPDGPVPGQGHFHLSLLLELSPAFRQFHRHPFLLGHVHGAHNEKDQQQEHHVDHGRNLDGGLFVPSGTMEMDHAPCPPWPGIFPAFSIKALSICSTSSITVFTFWEK